MLRTTKGTPFWGVGGNAAEVEIDTDTGLTRVVKYNAVNDFGTVINPMLVEGQIHGGVMQGLSRLLGFQKGPPQDYECLVCRYKGPAAEFIRRR